MEKKVRNAELSVKPQSGSLTVIKKSSKIVKKKKQLALSVGRPMKYEKKYCIEVVKYMAKGMSKEAFAGKIGIGKTTLYRWIEAKKEFRNAVEVGEQKRKNFFELNGALAMQGKLPGFRSDIWGFMMKFVIGDEYVNPNPKGSSNGEAIEGEVVEDSVSTVNRIVSKYGDKRLTISPSRTG